MGGRLFMIHVVLCGHGECVELSCHVVTIITLWSVWSYHVVVIMYCGHCVVISCCGHIVLWSVCGHKTLRSHYIMVTVCLSVVTSLCGLVTVVTDHVMWL